MGRGHRQRDQIPAVNGDARPFARPFARHGAGSALLEPAFQTDVPKRQRLERRSLAGVVGADQDHALAEFEFDLIEQLEIANRQAGQHRKKPRRSGPSRSNIELDKRCLRTALALVAPSCTAFDAHSLPWRRSGKSRLSADTLRSALRSARCLVLAPVHESSTRNSSSTAASRGRSRPRAASAGGLSTSRSGCSSWFSSGLLS